MQNCFKKLRKTENQSQSTHTTIIIEVILLSEPSNTTITIELSMGESNEESN
ncbi:MAG: hypothetical protein P9L91_04865 [Candidatus Zophobacter franzmannii]|nr:hypothetical protein [Candidatus Zophobacter franzmannii]